MRIAVTGPPGAGKTYTFPTFTHSDDMKCGGTWKEHQAYVVEFMNASPAYAIEGVMVTYALKHLREPPDVIYRLEYCYESGGPRTAGLVKAEGNRFYAYIMEHPTTKVQYMQSGQDPSYYD